MVGTSGGVTLDLDPMIFSILDDAYAMDNKQSCVAREMRRTGDGFDWLRFRHACVACGVAAEEFSPAELRRLKKTICK